MEERYILKLLLDTPYMHIQASTDIVYTYNRYRGFVWVLENLESPGILLWHFRRLEIPGKRLLGLKEKHEAYGRQ